MGSEVGVGIDLSLPGGDPHVALVHPAVQQTKFHDFKLILGVGQARSVPGPHLGKNLYDYCKFILRIEAVPFVVDNKNIS